nr:nucleotidyltransferase family protein [Pleionea sp. CnH1-48]
MPICELLTEQVLLEHLSEQQIDDVIKQARKSRLLPEVADKILAKPTDKMPMSFQRHLHSASILSNAHQRAISWEFDRIASALEQIDSPVVLLKGAAYLAQNIEHSRRRLYGDIDLLVAHDYLEEVEDRLRWAGWVSTHHNDYDQRYYRKWMHEIPPLQHAKRGSTLDVHHRILPPTARITLPGEPLIDKAIQCEQHPFFFVLSPADQIIHSAAHLFSDGEQDHGLRDLYDIYRLLEHFQADNPQFIELVVERANTLGLSRFMFYALRYVRKFFAPELSLSYEKFCEAKPSNALLTLMDILFTRALVPEHSSCSPTGQGLSQKALYIRGHYLRMPFKLLLPHLLRKAFSTDSKETIR